MILTVTSENHSQGGHKMVTLRGKLGPLGTKNGTYC